MINKKTRTLYLTTLLISSFANCHIIYLNYADEIYPSTQDTIAIPLISIIGVMTILLTLSIVQNPFYKQQRDQKTTNIISTIFALFATTASSILLIESIYYWLAPNHLGVSVLYFIVLLTYLIHQFNLYKKPVFWTKQSTYRGRLL